MPRLEMEMSFSGGGLGKMRMQAAFSAWSMLAKG